VEVADLEQFCVLLLSFQVRSGVIYHTTFNSIHDVHILISYQNLTASISDSAQDRSLEFIEGVRSIALD